MLNEATYYRATAAAQAIMAQKQSIQVDGKWGKFTQQTYDAASSDVRASVDKVVSALTGGGVAQLRMFRDAQRAAGTAATAKASASQQDVRKLIEAIAQKEGVPAATATRIAWLESRWRPDAVSPTGAKGVMQLTSIAIRDIAQRGGYQVTNPFDPVQNITGGVKYMKIVARDLGVPLTEAAKIYMGFNIGPSGAKNVMAGKPELAAKQISQQAYGKPEVYAKNVENAIRNAQA